MESVRLSSNKICQFCGYKTTSKNFYYCHLKIHVTPETRHQFLYSDLQLIEKYFTLRRNTKINSYKRRSFEKKYLCTICEKRYKTKSILNNHFVSNHTKEELIENGFEESFVDTHISKREKKLAYFKQYKSRKELNKPFYNALEMAKDEASEATENLLLIGEN